MNSLSYLSRQFDVLASTPPSTPTSERSEFVGRRKRRSSNAAAADAIPRAWSAKSLLFAPTSTRIGPKRSYSSPADIITLTRVASLASTSSSTSTSTSGDVKPTGDCSPVDSLIDRIFFVRVLLLAWDSLRSAWTTLLQIISLRKPLEPPAVVVVDEKESSDDEAPHSALRPQPSQRSNTDSDALSAMLSTSPARTDPLTATTASSLSRSSTPQLSARKTPFHLPKTLVLDLDETLIHSTSRPFPSGGGSGIFGIGKRNQSAGHLVEVVLGDRSTIYHVYKRPFVDFFLRTVSGWYTLVIFTASMQEYADPVIDWLDAGRGILGNRLFRDSCTQLPNGTYTKDLSVVESDLARVCLVDNSPVCYRINEANGIPIEGWTHDPYDEALLDLLPVLDSLRFTSDVRRVLGLRTAGLTTHLH